jgi:glutamate-1-semialdehyde aminotransferase
MSPRSPGLKQMKLNDAATSTALEKSARFLQSSMHYEKHNSVRYEAVNAMLLNEFLKAHRKMEEQGAIIAQLKKELQATAAHQQKQIEALTAGLQKVSAQLELNRRAPETVSNNH